MLNAIIAFSLKNRALVLIAAALIMVYGGYPLALVVFGGMLTSTVLDQLVTPALFFKFGSRIRVIRNLDNR